MRLSSVFSIFVAISIGVLAGCTGGGASKDEIVFGEYGSMTGSESSFGISTHRGVEMALDEANAKGGFNGKKFKVISYDNQGRSEEAVTAITKLITRDKVPLVIGEVASSRSIAAGAIAQQYKIPMISPASTNPKVTQLGDYIFRVCFIDPFQGKVMAKFAIENLKKTKAAILRDIRSDYSVGLADFFVKEFKAMGGEILVDTAYSTGDIDFKSQLTNIRSKKPEVIFIPGYYTEVGLIARQAKELGLAVPLLGGDGWDSEKLTEIGQDAIVGHYFSNHYSQEDTRPSVQGFIEKYRARYGETPDSMAVLGYDAAVVAVNAVKTAKDLTPASLRDALAATKGVPGVTGEVNLNEHRDAVKSAVVMKVAGPKKYSYVTTINP
ncbi:ABC transporter substrate-binding protein [bacterium]|nr:ABC transporter substrate-binding protein [bacterium]